MKILTQLINISLLQLCLVVAVQAQDASDFTSTALELSNTYLGGSARIQALGGAQTSLGGDISSTSSNPAGLGFFNRSEVSFSPSLNFLSTSSAYLGETTKENKVNFNFANLGVVMNKMKSSDNEDKWRGGSIGLSFNRVANFHNRISYEGGSFYNLDQNDEIIFDPAHPADLIDYAYYNTNVSGSGAVTFNNDIAELVFNTYMIDTFNMVIDRNIYDIESGSVAYPEPNFPTRQIESINSKGGIYQTAISYGGNYDDMIYLGASLGIMSVEKRVERTYTELPTDTDLANLVLRDQYEITGAGINATFGAIVRPTPFLLLGITYKTPSYYSLEQTREMSLEANFVDESFDDGFVYTPFTYNITTPGRLSGGLTYFFGKSGFITADVERVNYGGANLSNPSDNIPFTNENNDLNTFESVTNFRLGGEYRYDIFRLRAGYANTPDPIGNETVDRSQQQFSFGAGIRTRDYYVDFGIVNNLGTESTVSPYPGSATTLTDNKHTSAIFSVGFFF